MIQILSFLRLTCVAHSSVSQEVYEKRQPTGARDVTYVADLLLVYKYLLD